MTKFKKMTKAKDGTRMGDDGKSGMATEVRMRMTIDAKAGTSMGGGNDYVNGNKLRVSTEAKAGTRMGPGKTRMKAEAAKVMIAMVRAGIGTNYKMKVKIKANTGTENEKIIGWRTEAENWTDTRDVDGVLLDAGAGTEIEDVKAEMKPGLEAEMGTENGTGRGMEGKARTERKSPIKLTMESGILVPGVKRSKDQERRMPRIIDLGGRIRSLMHGVNVFPSQIYDDRRLKIGIETC